MKFGRFGIAALSTFALFSTLRASPSLAQEVKVHQGLITNYHLNAGPTTNITERGVCVDMLPALPAPGYACVYKDNPLYQEITNLLLQAASTDGIACKITFTERRGLQPAIRIAECSRYFFFPES